MTPQMWLIGLAILAAWDFGRRLADSGKWADLDDYEDLADSIHVHAEQIEALQKAGVELDKKQRDQDTAISAQNQATVALASRTNDMGKVLTNLGLAKSKIDGR